MEKKPQWCWAPCACDKRGTPKSNLSSPAWALKGSTARAGQEQPQTAPRHSSPRKKKTKECGPQGLAMLRRHFHIRGGDPAGVPVLGAAREQPSPLQVATLQRHSHESGRKNIPVQPGNSSPGNYFLLLRGACPGLPQSNINLSSIKR